MSIESPCHRRGSQGRVEDMGYTDLIKQLYPEHHNRVTQSLSASLQIPKVENAPEAEANWYKHLQIYVTYPDAFHDDWRAGFEQLTQNLDHIQNLGCNAIHVLPFLSSPQIDGGFDVSEYYIVRDNVGGNQAFEDFLLAAQKRKMAVFMDLVLNHISQEHRWFSQAISGDRFYRGFFYNSLTKPELIKVETRANGKFAIYQTNAGQVEIRIIFPEQVGDIPHWRQAEDGYWYYHTFYPQQLDLNWNNHHVFIAMAKTLIYWARKGLLFRLDAIPFVGKEIAPGQIETSQRTHVIVQALHSIAQHAVSQPVFLVEANQPTSKLLRYFGQESTNYRDQVIEAELAYDFPLMNAIWTSLATNDPEPIAQTINQIQDQVPDWAGWVTFLRNHDELSLEYAKPEARQLILQAFGKAGLPFRAGHDLSGRTASLLGRDLTVFAHSVLASLPGDVAIIYGDEIGKVNDLEFMQHQTEYKRARSGDESVADDTRDINRGYLDPAQLNSAENQQIYSQIQNLLQLRLKLKFADQKCDIEADSQVLTVRYPELKLKFVINFADEAKTVKLKSEYRPIYQWSYQAAEIKQTKTKLVLAPKAVWWGQK